MCNSPGKLQDNCPRSTEQCQSCGDSIFPEHSLRFAGNA